MLVELVISLDPTDQARHAAVARPIKSSKSLKIALHNYEESETKANQD